MANLAALSDSIAKMLSVKEYWTLGPIINGFIEIQSRIIRDLTSISHFEIYNEPDDCTCFVKRAWSNANLQFAKEVIIKAHQEYLLGLTEIQAHLFKCENENSFAYEEAKAIHVVFIEKHGLLLKFKHVHETFHQRIDIMIAYIKRNCGCLWSTLCIERFQAAQLLLLEASSLLHQLVEPIGVLIKEFDDILKELGKLHEPSFAEQELDISRESILVQSKRISPVFADFISQPKKAHNDPEISSPAFCSPELRAIEKVTTLLPETYSPVQSKRRKKKSKKMTDAVNSGCTNQSNKIQNTPLSDQTESVSVVKEFTNGYEIDSQSPGTVNIGSTDRSKKSHNNLDISASVKEITNREQNNETAFISDSGTIMDDEHKSQMKLYQFIDCIALFCKLHGDVNKILDTNLILHSADFLNEKDTYETRLDWNFLNSLHESGSPNPRTSITSSP